MPNIFDLDPFQRRPEVRESVSGDRCVLCGRTQFAMFFFGESNGFREESLCLPCLQEAVRLLLEKM